MRLCLDSHFDNDVFNIKVEKLRSLMETYRIVKSDLNYYSLKLERTYSSDLSPSLEFLYDLEDKQFNKLMLRRCQN